MLFEFDTSTDQKARIKVIGVGGAGGRAIHRMISSGLSGVDFHALDTNAQDLGKNAAKIKVQIGRHLVRGSAEGKLEAGRAAIEQEQDSIIKMVQEADLVFVVAGMGGGTGSGIAPVIAQIAREQGALTIGIVTRPFQFEGPKRMERADTAVGELEKFCDTVIVVPNQKLLGLIDKRTALANSFKLADSILLHATRGISDLINVHGLINLDFADVSTVMKDMGGAVMGTGIASGEERAALAAEQAVSNPLLESANFKGARGVLVNITGGGNMTLQEVDQASSIILEKAGDQANIIFGAVVDSDLKEELRVTVIAAGYGNRSVQVKPAGRARETSVPEKAPHRELAPAASVNRPELHVFEMRKTELDQVIPYDPAAKPLVFDDFGGDLDVPAFIRQRLA